MAKPRKIGQLKKPIVYQSTANKTRNSWVAQEWFKKQSERRNDIRVISEEEYNGSGVAKVYDLRSL